MKKKEYDSIEAKKRVYSHSRKKMIPSPPSTRPNLALISFVIDLTQESQLIPSTRTSLF